jgi:uncharacterized protein
MHVVITGASSGIGKATALAFAKRGVRVTLAARSRGPLEEVASACRGFGHPAEVITADVSKADDCAALIERAEAIAPIDVLVNNAGIGRFDPVVSAKNEDFEAMMQTNFFGTVYTTRAVLPHMLQRRGGSIVNVASIAGIMGFAGMSGYCASKFAIIGFTESLRNEVQGAGIKVSLVCPATTETNFFDTAEKDKMPGASRLMRSLDSDAVAKAIVRSARTGKARIMLPIEAHTYMRMKELFPRLAHSLMRNVSAMIERRYR